jgi:hypothetical protein
MDTTWAEVEKKLNERLGGVPPFAALVASPELTENLGQVGDFFALNQNQIERLTIEIKLLLAGYQTLANWSDGIEQSLGVAPDTARQIANLVETVALASVIDDLEAYSLLWEEQAAKEAALPQVEGTLKEKLELRPDVPVTPLPEPAAPKPLTREELLSALAGKRTMAGDMARLQGADTPAPATPTARGPVIGFANQTPVPPPPRP